MTERREIGAALRDALPKFDAPPSLEAWARIQAHAADHSDNIALHGTRSALFRGPVSLRLSQFAAILIIGVVLGWGAASLRVSGARSAPDQQIAEAVVDTHVRSLLPGHLTDVLSTDRHTVKPWFIGKTDIAPPVNDLSASGFPLYGGRLDYVDGRSAAAIVYRRRQHVINLFIMRSAADETRAQSLTIRGYSVQHWIAGDLSYWAVTDAASSDLEAFRAAYLAAAGTTLRSP